MNIKNLAVTFTLASGVLLAGCAPSSDDDHSNNKSHMTIPITHDDGSGIIRQEVFDLVCNTYGVKTFPSGATDIRGSFTGLKPVSGLSMEIQEKFKALKDEKRSDLPPYVPYNNDAALNL